MADDSKPTPCPPRPRLDFIAEVNQLAKATRILREAVGDSAEDSTYGDSSMPMVARCSPEIICLRTAISLWCNVHNLNVELDKQSGPGQDSPLLQVFGMLQRPPPPPTTPPLPTDEGGESPESDGQ